MANVENPRPSFDHLVKSVRPLVFEAVPRTVSVGIVDEITEDIVYMIQRGKTLEMMRPNFTMKISDRTAQKIL